MKALIVVVLLACPHMVAMHYVPKHKCTKLLARVSKKRKIVVTHIHMRLPASFRSFCLCLCQEELGCAILSVSSWKGNMSYFHLKVEGLAGNILIF